MRSEKIEIKPISIPPKYAAVGMYLFKVATVDDY
jgi:hypothetical protein